ncbi:MAG: hypothetical protein Q4A21_02805 [bacterium]|nr:hypothetical protein [bacterium]
METTNHIQNTTNLDEILARSVRKIPTDKQILIAHHKKMRRIRRKKYPNLYDIALTQESK